MPTHVLVVDDSAVDLQRLQQVLTRAGYAVSTAADGLQALECARRERPDAILMDVSMPGMDGFAATRALRGDAQTRHIPVVIVSSRAQPADRAWAQMLGASGYVGKPFSDDQILAGLREVQLQPGAGHA